MSDVVVVVLGWSGQWRIVDVGADVGSGGAHVVQSTSDVGGLQDRLSAQSSLAGSSGVVEAVVA